MVETFHWIQPTEFPLLNPSTIHVWRVRNDEESIASESHRILLSLDELQRAERFRRRVDYLRYVNTRGVLRLLLASYLALDPRFIRFTYTRYGKPLLESKECILTFNLSHSDDVALIAFSLGETVGIDVERIRPDPVDLKLARAFLTEEELDVLRSQDEVGRRMAFFKFWTRKESLVKAIGAGLQHPLTQLRVSLAPKQLVHWHPDSSEVSAETTYSIYELNVEPGYAGALAAPGEKWLFFTFLWSD